jgi:hypothetical protein
MSRAEDLALEALDMYEPKGINEQVGLVYTKAAMLGMFKDGYHQAEKDLELTYDDICEIMEIREDVLEMDSYENLYEEILKRFKERKQQ